EGRLVGIDELRRLAASAEETRTVVVVDESYLNYLGPADSAEPLPAQPSNLLVLRGVSKGYCTGGLRVGYAVASAPLAPAVREVACPLAVSSLALGFALELLAAGAVFPPLRARLGVAKPATLEAPRPAAAGGRDADHAGGARAARDCGRSGARRPPVGDRSRRGRGGARAPRDRGA